MDLLDQFCAWKPKAILLVHAKLCSLLFLIESRVYERFQAWT